MPVSLLRWPVKASRIVCNLRGTVSDRALFVAVCGQIAVRISQHRNASEAIASRKPCTDAETVFLYRAHKSRRKHVHTQTYTHTCAHRHARRTRSLDHARICALTNSMINVALYARNSWPIFEHATQKNRRTQKHDTHRRTS